MFMSLPEIARYATEYGASIDDLNCEITTQNGWLLYSVNDEPVGLTQLEIISGCAAQFHPYILREFKEHYDDMVQEIFTWFIEEVPDQIVKLNAVIPSHCKGALLAAEQAGMVTEGADRESFLTYDGPCDRILKGILRREMKA